MRCEERDRDRYGRAVAVCFVGGTDVEAWMVAQGWALAYRKYSSDYVSQETRRARRGEAYGAASSPRRGSGELRGDRNLRARSSLHL